LATALYEPPARPGRDLWRLLRADGLLTPGLLLGGLLFAALGTFVEAIVFRGLFDVGRELGLARQRLVAAGAMVGLLALMLLIERPVVDGVFRLGRRLEARLRATFLHKIPRLGDRYFQSRPISDMAERSHSLHRLRQLPLLAAQLTRVAFELLLTTIGIVWLDPAAAPLALAAAALALAWPLSAQPVLAEHDLRVRTHTGALGRFYLDALLGLTAVRTHGAERPVRGEHEGLLVEWARAGLRLHRTGVVVEAGQLVLGFALAAALLHGHLRAGAETGVALLMVYWALQIPALGQEAAGLLRQYPLLRNTTLRMLEPLGAATDMPEADDDVAGPEAPVAARGHRGRALDLRLEQVVVRAGGHTILDHVDLHVPAGQHVAIVGASGAGKSSLVGLLLGWHRPASGTLVVDGEPLTGARLERLRRETAWVDPSVQLWNASLFENLTYADDGTGALAAALDGADLQSVLQTMPDGLQTHLGESGRRVSGGEGQRVRFGRALLQADARLVLLDEPFRGLDSERRSALLGHARAVWQDATLVCVTHDIADTRRFERVLVVDGGRIVEDGAPDALLQHPGSRYRALLEQEVEIRERLWTGDGWRRVGLRDGRLVEEPRRAPAHDVAAGVAAPTGALPSRSARAVGHGRDRAVIAHPFTHGRAS
jgi:ATP-binding cassette subfamily B protein